MEISLRKPQREVFNLIKKQPGSFVRKHKKRLENIRTYWRLMSKEYNPIQNITPSRIKPLFDADIMEEVGEKEFTIKQDVTLADKRKKTSNN